MLIRDVSPTFKLPTIDEIDVQNEINSNDIDPQIQELTDAVLISINEVFETMYENRDNFVELFRKVTRFICYKSAFINSSSLLIVKLVYAENNNMLVRLSFNNEALTLLLATFIRDNIEVNGIFTELWEQPNSFCFRYLGNPTDRIIEMESRQEPIPDLIENIFSNSFEEDREHTIKDLYEEHTNHEIEVTSPSTLSEEKNKEYFCESYKECGLCCERPYYICSRCKYPLCENCLKHIKHSTGDCPSCRMKPWNVIEIPEDNFNIEQPKVDE